LQQTQSASARGREESPMRIKVVDMHTAGEPVRIITEGFPELRGADILEKRRCARDSHDHLRRALMLEPRGHAGMYGVVPVAPMSPLAVLGALFIHNDGYSTMCGHATIALGRWLVESGRVAACEPETRFVVELPCGLVAVTCTVNGGRVSRISFESVPAFLSHAGVRIDVPGLGDVLVDVSYGGAFYAILPASQLGLDFFATPLEQLHAAACPVTDAARRTITIEHPDAEDLGFLYGTILTDDAPPPQPTFNLCVFAEGQIDRSPTGSGVTARLARDHARGLIAPGTVRLFAGPTGVQFSGEVLHPADRSQENAVIVRVSGESSFIGEAAFAIEAEDPLRYGFSLPRNFDETRRVKP
jgi:proline racemase